MQEICKKVEKGSWIDLCYVANQAQESGKRSNNRNILANQNDQQTFKPKSWKSFNINLRLPSASTAREAYHVRNKQLSQECQIDSEGLEDQVSW